MGVYIFKCGQYIKVGKYKGQNAWSRVARRLFQSVKCPKGLEITIDNLELIAWFPDLREFHEQKTHRMLKLATSPKFHAVGEWFHLCALPSALRILHSMGRSQKLLTQHKMAALRTWRRL